MTNVWPASEHPSLLGLCAFVVIIAGASWKRKKGGHETSPHHSNCRQRGGAVVLGLVALDLIATVTTLAIGAQWLRR